jgi:nitrogen fixation protein FixH
MSPTILPTARRETADRGLTGRHVLFVIVTFFGVVFAVNGVLLSKAISTHSGIVAVEPYRKGLDYNRRIEADERQELLGWKAEVTLVAGGRLTLDVTGDGGSRIPDLVVSATIGRPSTSRHDKHLRLEEDRDGLYAADAGALEPGAWIAIVEVTRAPIAGAPPVTDTEPLFRLKRRLWLKP